MVCCWLLLLELSSLGHLVLTNLLGARLFSLSRRRAHLSGLVDGRKIISQRIEKNKEKLEKIFFENLLDGIPIHVLQ